MEIVQLKPESAEWPLLVAYLKSGNDARWVLDDEDQPKEDSLIFLVGSADGEVMASLTLIRQEITIPETEWSTDMDRTLRDQAGQPLYETFVQTFRVDEAHRRKGIGRALQIAALRVTEEAGCIQMRSWSSLNASANYALKLSLGFGFHPEVQQTASGLRVSGGYFVKRVSDFYTMKQE